MDKKGGFSDIKILFLALVLFSISFVVYNAFFSVATLDYDNTAIIAYGGSDGHNNGTKGGEEETINITIVANTDGPSYNITSFNLTLPVGNYSFKYFINPITLGFEQIDQNSTVDLIGGVDNLSNVTSYGSGGATTTWGCFNMTNGAGDDVIRCSTADDVGELASSVDVLGAGANTTLILMINVTGGGSGGTVLSEEIAQIQLQTANDSVFAAGFSNTTILNLTIDGVGPRLVDINITDGNTTLLNQTEAGVAPLLFPLNDTGYLSNYLSNATNLTVTLQVQEDSIDTVLLYYNCTTDGSNVSTALDGDLGGAFFVPSGLTNHSYQSIRGAGTSSLQVATNTVAYTGIVDNTCTSNEAVTVTLALILNDTFGNIVTVNGSATGDPFIFSVNGTGDGTPTVYKVNVTDDTNTVTTSSGEYLAEGNHTFNIEFTGADINLTDVVLVYNTTGALDLGTNGYVADVEASIIIPNIDNKTGTLDNSKQPAVITAGNDFSGNASNTVRFALLVNSSVREDDGVGGINKTDTRYAMIAGPYSYIIDGTQPTATLTAPSDTSIGPGDSISYTCGGADTQSGVANYKATITKPSGTTVTKTSTSSTTALTFSSTDTSEAGSYSIECKTTDNVGNTKTSTSSFSVLYSASAGGSGGGGGGGSSSGTTVSFDVDFSQEATTEAAVQVAEGSTRTFSFDGSTTHTLKVDSLSDTAATITIASDPQTFVLNVGESRKVDVNNDGLDDVEVTLNSVYNGTADITIKKIEEGAKVVVEEEEAAAAEAQETVSPEGEVSPEPVSTGRSLTTTITVVVIVLILLLLAGYYFMQKK